MKTLNAKAVVRLMATAASTAYLTSTPVMAKQVEPEQKVEVREGTQPLAKQGYVAGLDTIHNQNDIQPTAAAPTRKMGLTEVDGKKVYIDHLGQKTTGVLSTPEGEYFFDQDGVMQTGKVKEGNTTSFYDKTTGLKQYGVVEQEGKTYVLNDQGNIQTGWIDQDGHKRYLDQDGALVKNRTMQIDGVQYSFSEQGDLETNITKDGFIYNEKGEGRPDVSGYDKIAQAALAQVGVNQDCTMLVTNSLAAVGINFHGWPEDYLSLGPLTNDPVPGDIIVYAGHVAIYIGNGQAVHGGWNGYTTAVFGVECSKPLIGFVHPTLPQ